jgi:branched-chain amino acid aminotransferase
LFWTAVSEAESTIAWLNGDFLPAAALSIPVGDAGFVLGATVTEQLRTFRGRLYQPDAHGTRLQASLAIAGIDLTEACGGDTTPAGLSIASVLDAAAEVARKNAARRPADDDLGLSIFVTPGDLAAQHEGRPGTPRVAIHSFPLAFRLWYRSYTEGVSLRRVQVRQVPDACWPVQLKCRSRMHYHLADREAAALEPGSRALLEELDGTVCETSTANVITVRKGVLSTPIHALEGVSLRSTRELAEALDLAWEPRRLVAADVASADEVLLTSTPNCLLPVTRYEGSPIGDGTPGPIYTRLLAAWSDAVGVDIPQQATNRAASQK